MVHASREAENSPLISRYRIAPLTLRFLSDMEEARYQAAMLRSSIYHIRYAYSFAMIVTGVYVILDLSLFSDNHALLSRAVWIRFLVLLPIQLLFISMTYYSGFQKIAQVSGTALLLLFSAGICALAFRANEAVIVDNYSSITMVLIYGYFFSGIFFRFSLPAGLVITLLYILVIYDSSHTPSAVASSMETSLLVVSIFLGLASYQKELVSRRLFIRERQLEEGGEALAQKNIELEGLNKALRESEFETQSRAGALVAAKEQLRALAEERNIEKSKFLADAAHDLSQPLQVLSTYLSVAGLAAEKGDLVRTIEIVGLANQALQRSLTLFHNVLEISRIETGFTLPSYSRFDVQALLDELLTSFAPIAEARDVQIRRRRKQEKLIVQSDYHMLRRVISNLISNAIKYSNPKGPSRAAMLIGAVRVGGRIRIDVVDNGIGIPSDKFDSVFKPFVQLHNVERNQENGVGLGLSIVKAMVGLLEGHRVDMTSVEGRGTRFSLEVPRGDLFEGQTIAMPSLMIDKSEINGLYILYVEDDAHVRESIAALLDVHGAKFDKYESLEDLRARVNRVERVPDIVLTDYRLPGGCTAADVASVVEAEFQEKIPILVLTGEVVHLDDCPWLVNGRILRKPIAPGDLCREISALADLNRREALE